MKYGKELGIDFSQALEDILGQNLNNKETPGSGKQSPKNSSARNNQRISEEPTPKDNSGTNASQTENRRKSASPNTKNSPRGGSPRVS